MRKQKQKYPSIAEKIIDDSDIVLEILDSRFPEETRNHEIEKKILSKNKKLIFVLNKSDLIKEKRINKFQELNPKILVSVKDRTTIKKLRDFIKKLSKKIQKKDEEKITVGIIGYPNTGKSSLINILIGKNSAKTSSQSGFTKALQKLKLSENINLIDSPGVIPEKEYSGSDIKKISEHAKLGARDYSRVKNPEIAVHDLMNQFSKEIGEYYNIETEGNSETFIEHLGRQKGFLKKRGIVDEDKTARLILKDWQAGNIKL